VVESTYFCKKRIKIRENSLLDLIGITDHNRGLTFDKRIELPFDVPYQNMVSQISMLSMKLMVSQHFFLPEL
jgi:hypothetical protein